jgi:phosphoribosylformylglycinamidine synthase
VRVEEADTAFTNRCRRGDVLDLPVKHGEGCYVADETTLRSLEAGRQIVLRYTDAEGRVTPVRRTARSGRSPASAMPAVTSSA